MAAAGDDNKIRREAFEKVFSDYGKQFNYTQYSNGTFVIADSKKEANAIMEESEVVIGTQTADFDVTNMVKYFPNLTVVIVTYDNPNVLNVYVSATPIAKVQNMSIGLSERSKRHADSKTLKVVHSTL